MTTLTATLHSAAATAASPLSRIAVVFEALGEGLDAYHKYERLRARGVPHAEAAARSFAK